MNINWDSQSLFALELGGSIILLVAIIMYFFPPKKINNWYGYRTGTSMETQEKWDFAQHYSAILMMKCAIFMMVAGVIISIIPLDKSTDTLLSTPTLLLTIGFLYFRTERAITKQFGKNKTHN